jgi:type I phosphodiesterase/nucleotide pyrophosphatase
VIRRDCRRLAAGLLCALALASATGRAQPRTDAPRLAVIVSIDGLSWEWLRRNGPWFEHGLRRLLDEGHIETNARYRHINTETAPGHAALGTGAPPRVTGIVSNRWWEARGGRMVYVSSAAQPVPEGTPGAVNGALQGPGNLRVATLGDRLITAQPGARVVALSGKDRSAALMAGRDRRHAAYWWDTRNGRFVTSAAYATDGGAGARGREIVERWNRGAGEALKDRFGLLWRRLLAAPPKRPEPLPTPQAALEKYQLPQQGIGFDHDLSHDERGYFASFYYSPFIDEVVAELALEFLRDPVLGLGRGPAPDLLALSFSGNDTVSHSYGRESEETLDALRRLDRQLGRVLLALDELPKGSVVLGLSADHGFPPIPEVHRRQPGAAAGRLLYKDLSAPATYYEPTFRDLLNRELAGELCLPMDARPILDGEGWTLVYDRPSLPLKTVAGSCGAAGRSVSTAQLDAALQRVIGRLHGGEIEQLLLVSERDRWPRDQRATEFAQNDYDKERSGDAFLFPRPNVLFHWDPARGSHHGSHHEYDAHVPLIFWGGPFRPGVSEADSAPYDLAPTLAALLGVTLSDATGTSRAPSR